MKLSKNTSNSAGFHILKRCGFDACDYSLGRELSPKDGIFADIDNVSDQQIAEHFSSIKEIADELDFEVGQIHSDFTGHIRSYASLDDVVKRQIASIKATHYLGAKFCVIHPVIPRGVLYETIQKESFDKAADFYKRLTDTLEKYDVYCCLENMWHLDPVYGHITPTIFSRAQEMVEMSDLLGERFKICLDVGHGLLTQDDPVEMVKICGDKLVCLHSHDNDGLLDMHAFPFHRAAAPYGTTWKPLRMDWIAFMKALDEVNYRGNLNFEVGMPGPADLEELHLKYLADIGKYLISLREIQY
jgi:sugar phosphate isomerase/epimerase